MKQKGSIASSLILLLVIVAIGFAWLNRNAIYDWFRLHNYQPDQQISQIATDDTMTTYARHMFYINRPSIQDKTSFNQNCPNDGGEQTIILGCYHGNETGIYLYSVTDPKLVGVEQVTAAHETLHAVYDRLSLKDKNYVDGLLENFYKNDLKDKRVISTIESYQKTEPNDVIDEMHSVFGTEVDKLPAALETYYKQYFINRQKVVSFAQTYQQTFTSNQAKAAAYLSQIKAIENQLNNLKSQIDSQEQALITQGQQLNSERHQISDPNQFNSKVNQYNAQVINYKTLVNQYNSLIDKHNALVLKYLAINTETNQLAKELDSRSASISTQ